MRADDPRHGTVAGYNRIPCRDECCKKAMAAYKARWAWDKHNGRDRIVSTLGSRRRIQALNALGWSNQEIAVRMGNDRSNLTRVIYGETLTRKLAERIARVYDELSMKLPTGNAQAIANVRNRAARNGWPPPLAWDNIDDPDERPRGVGYQERTRAEILHDIDTERGRLSDALAELDVSRKGLEKWCQRNGMNDLYSRLVMREIGEEKWRQWTGKVGA